MDVAAAADDGRLRPPNCGDSTSAIQSWLHFDAAAVDVAAAEVRVRQKRRREKREICRVKNARRKMRMRRRFEDGDDEEEALRT